MARVISKAFGTQKDVILNREYAITRMIDSTTISTNAAGRKIAVAGTIVGHATLKLVDDETAKASPLNTANGQGILINDIDVTDCDMPAAILIRGVVDKAKVAEANSGSINAAVNIPTIQFVI